MIKSKKIIVIIGFVMFWKQSKQEKHCNHKVCCVLGSKSSLPPPHPVHIPYSVLIHKSSKYSLAPPSSATHSLSNSYIKLMKILSGASLVFQYTFLNQFLYKINGNSLWNFTPPPVHVSYSIFILIWWTCSLYYTRERRCGVASSYHFSWHAY